MSHLDLLVFLQNVSFYKGNICRLWGSTLILEIILNMPKQIKKYQVRFNNYFYETSPDIHWNKSIEMKYLKRDWQKFMAFLVVANYGQKLFKSAASSLPKTNVNSDTPPLISEFTIQ